ncbi:azurin [Salegentibacter sp. F188]|uniref:Azurin n=1 Tax=Autumnicola patrickiae TaxID=3075591 RepID=A0ABU3E119_9FLAO|nr:azurin [Salegentibacter sp. F188]MDT0689593.1 azurin [Salegentibacter sp. F188]
MKNYNKALLLLAVLAIIACGEKKEEKEQYTISDTNSTESTTTVKSQASDEEKVIEVSLSAGDQMQFDKNEIKVKAGSTVKLTLTHTGEMDEKVMGHNFVLLKEGTDINAFGQKAMQAADNNYIPEDGEQVIAYTEILGGGESATIEFNAPEAGTYDFICSFPGHYAIMKGKFIVE